MFANVWQLHKFRISWSFFICTTYLISKQLCEINPLTTCNSTPHCEKNHHRHYVLIEFRAFLIKKYRTQFSCDL